jgi:hypothetical protein
MMITGKVFVIIYYCADVAWSDRHTERLLIHTKSKGLFLKQNETWQILSHIKISTF